MQDEFTDSTPNTTRQLFLDLLESFVIALTIFIIIYNFVAQPHRVQGDSMLPTFRSEQYLLTEKISYRLHQPERGDIIVLKYPANPQKDFIKRIVGLPGETLRLENGQIFIDGVLLSESYLQRSSQTFGGNTIKDGVDFTIPEDEYIVMGDNRTQSSDSRTWGTVPEKNLIGKAFFVYWPPEWFGPVSQ